ncbi:MAG: hypothetical protein J5861_03455 [Desulfovibrio sp.]|nr:hypothetical protein [Desulfovibrio sp.]
MALATVVITSLSDTQMALASQMLSLPSDKGNAWLFVVLFGAGVLAQLVGTGWRWRVLLVIGAFLTGIAAVLDNDPVLAVGQLIVSVVLWPCASRSGEKTTNEKMGRKAPSFFR